MDRGPIPATVKHGTWDCKTNLACGVGHEKCASRTSQHSNPRARPGQALAGAFCNPRPCFPEAVSPTAAPAGVVHQAPEEDTGRLRLRVPHSTAEPPRDSASEGSLSRTWTPSQRGGVSADETPARVIVSAPASWGACADTQV